MDRDKVTLAAGAVLLLSLSVLYEFMTPAFAEGSAYLEPAFVIASLAWIVGYVNCRGFEWGDNTAINALYAVSWGLLLGMEFTTFVPEQIASYAPWGAGVAIMIHMVAFGATVLDGDY